MKIFTFAGFTKHLKKLDFDYVVLDKTFNDITPQLIKGTIHYVKIPKGEKKMEFIFENIDQVFKHIPEFVLISW